MCSSDLALSTVEQLIPFCYQMNGKCSGGTVFIEVDGFQRGRSYLFVHLCRLRAGAIEPPLLGCSTLRILFWIPLPYQRHVTLRAVSFNLLVASTLGCSSKQERKLYFLTFKLETVNLN